MASYQILVSWSAEDGVFVATVPDLPGCLAHGATQNEAVENVRQAIGLYLEDVCDHGETMPEPRRYQLVRA